MSGGRDDSARTLDAYSEAIQEMMREEDARKERLSMAPLPIAKVADDDALAKVAASMRDIGFADQEAAHEVLQRNRKARALIVSRKIAALTQLIDHCIQADRDPVPASRQGAVTLRLRATKRRRRHIRTALRNRVSLRQHHKLDGIDLILHLGDVIFGGPGHLHSPAADEMAKTIAERFQAHRLSGDAK